MVWCGVAETPLEEEEHEDEDEIVEGQKAEEEEKTETPLSQEQREMVKRLHVNLGHLPVVERMITMLKVAKSQTRVTKFVKEKFCCDICMKQRKEIRRRRAAVPRTFEFNRTVDAFYLHWGGK
jgi:excinuclease UvrABC ATPase subunit